jgi:hypothetical protein
MSDVEQTPEPEQARKSFGWLFWFFVIVVILSFVGLTQPRVIRSAKKSELTEATINLRQIGLALFEFDTEYNSFPNDSTAALVAKKHPKHGHDLSGKSSNALFRQLIATGMAQSEQMFYAKNPGVRRPNDKISPGRALEKGEVGFAYIAGLSTAGNPARILAFAPVIPGTTKFDPKPFQGMAVFLRIDNSVISMKIHQDGRVYSEGFDILSPEHPLWNGHALDIRYPE